MAVSAFVLTLSTFLSILPRLPSHTCLLLHTAYQDAVGDSHGALIPTYSASQHQSNSEHFPWVFLRVCGMAEQLQTRTLLRSSQAPCVLMNSAIPCRWHTRHPSLCLPSVFISISYLFYLYALFPTYAFPAQTDQTSK